MKILIIRHTDQPAVNICDNIKKFSSHDCKIINRDEVFLDKHGVDLIFYYNVNDLFQPETYAMLLSSRVPICVGLQSYRILFEVDWVAKFLKLNIIGVCSPSKEIINKFISEVGYMLDVYNHTPFSADERYFSVKSPIQSEGKLRVGYVGSFRDDKKFLEVIKPALDMLKDKIEPVIYGRASGKRLGHKDMSFGYNNMDCLVVGSSHESGPMPPLEAALCGRPTITTRCGMMEDVFDNDSACFIDGNYKSLAAAIDLLYNNRLLCKEKGANARRRMFTFWNWKNLIEHQDNFFKACYEIR
jgi:glycosyltransferase involved in cell wall biosynthesis